MAYNLAQFIGKYQLALETAQKENPEGGLCGLEVEWNLLDEGLHPLVTVGAGPGQKSFVDFLIDDCLAPWARQYTQLEVFHWMIEWVTRPYYSPCAAIYETRLMEALLLNALARAGTQFGEHLYAWHGNLLFPTSVKHDSIPIFAGSGETPLPRTLCRSVRSKTGDYGHALQHVVARSALCLGFYASLRHETRGYAPGGL